MRTINKLLALLLLGLPLPMSACQPYIMAWCNWQTDEVEVWQYPCIQLHKVTISAKKLSFFGIEIDLGLGPYTIIPESVADLDNGKMIGTIPTKCKYLRDLNLGHPNEMGSPIANKILGMTHAAGPDSLAATSAPSLSQVDAFPYFSPVPAVLPSNFAIPQAASTGHCDGSRSVYQVQNENDTVSHLGLCPSQLIKQIQVCSSPLELAVTPDASTVLVTCYNNTIDWIDTATDKVTFSLNTNDFPAGIAISPDGTKAYVTNYFDISPNPELLVIDVAKHTILNTIPLSAAFPGVVALTPDGTQAWVNYFQQNVVDIFDLTSGTFSGRIDLQETTQNGIAFNPTGTRAYIAAGASDLAVVDTGTLKVLTKVTVTNTPLDVVMSIDGTRVLVGSYAQGAISLVDTQTNKVVQTLSTDGAMQGLNALLGNLSIP